MTAEIAILNNGAVALAADSAVTWSGETAPKIYNTVNKLFMLSKYHPVGVMVYGNAELLGVPWETIIKIHRKHLGDCRFDRLEQYAETFLEFLSGNEILFPAEAQRTQVARTTQRYLMRVREDIDKRVERRTNAGAVTDDEVIAIIETVVHEHLDAWQKVTLIPGVEPKDIEAAVKEYVIQVDEAIDSVFEAVPVPVETRAKLHQLSANLFARAQYVMSTSGLVIAGFGELDVIPSLHEFTVSGVILGRLRYASRRTASASEGASITPFAQSEMVSTFMEGVNPSFRQVVAAYLAKILGELPDRLMQALKPNMNLSPHDDEALLQRLTEACATINTSLAELVQEYTLRQHVLPIVGAVSALPKNQLAEMAEALVNLTSFRQKVSGVTETVGGPIDVAVISKGDGFVWIKRKHYFEPALNPQFFANYYRQPRIEETDQK